MLLAPLLIKAQGLVPCGQPGNPCGFCDIFALISNIIRFFLVPTATNANIAIVPLLGTLFLVIGGFFILTAGGDPQRQTRGKNVLLATIIGLVIIYGSWIFLSLIFDTFTKVQWNNWAEIQC